MKEALGGQDVALVWGCNVLERVTLPSRTTKTHFAILNDAKIYIKKYCIECLSPLLVGMKSKHPQACSLLSLQGLKGLLSSSTESQDERQN